MSAQRHNVIRELEEWLTECIVGVGEKREEGEGELEEWLTECIVGVGEKRRGEV